MCGIFAVIKKSEAAQLDLTRFQNAFETIAHRGKDHSGIFEHPLFLMGHKRLSIIDTSAAAHQPFFSSDKTQCIIYNGELFNYKKLRITLTETYNITFNTESDTEVLLHFLDNGGDLNALQGFWSFCYINLNTNTVLISRDRYGVKPLYFYEDTNCIAISSETHPIADYFNLKTINKNALNGYLKFTYITNNQSIYDNLQQLKPGHITSINLNSNQMHTQSYYQLPTQPATQSDLSTIKKTIQDKLEASVAKRLVADVPIGSFLSGGVDSSLVSVLAHQQKQDLECFTVKFSDYPFFDESDYAISIAKQFKINQTLITFSEAELLQTVVDYLERIDEPFADSSALAMFLLCKKVSASLKVALTGDGADELFGGYRKHKAYAFAAENKWLHRFNFLANGLQGLGAGRQSYFANKIRQLHKIIELSDKSPAEQYLFLAANGGLSANDCLKADYFQTDQSDMRRIQSHLNADHNSFLALDFEFPLLGDMLVKADRMSMLHSLELRNPFLDSDLVDYVFSIPAKYKFDAHHTKHILKMSFEHLLPKQIINRSKKGFEVPLQAWLTGPLRDIVVEKWCNKQFIEDQGIFHWQKVEALIKDASSRNSNTSVYNLWSLIVFNAWYKRRIMI